MKIFKPLSYIYILTILLLSNINFLFSEGLTKEIGLSDSILSLKVHIDIKSLVSCNILKLNSILQSLKTDNKHKQVFLIVETESKGDAQFLSKKFSIPLIEDNNDYLTLKYKSEIIIEDVYKNASIYHPIPNLEAFNKLKYKSKQTQHLSEAKSVHETEEFKSKDLYYVKDSVLLDTDNKMLVTVKDNALNTVYSLPKEYIHLKDKSKINWLKEHDILWDEELVGAIYNEYYSKYTFLMRSVIQQLDTLEDGKCEIHPYPILYEVSNNFSESKYSFLKNLQYATLANKNDTTLLLLRKMPSDSSSIILGVVGDSSFSYYTNQQFYQTFKIHLNNILGFGGIFNTNYGVLLLDLLKKEQIIYNLTTGEKYFIQGLMNSTSVSEATIAFDNLYILSYDNKHIYIKIYNLKTNVIVSEYVISNDKDNEILSCCLFSMSKDKLSILSKGKISRWEKIELVL